MIRTRSAASAQYLSDPAGQSPANSSMTRDMRGDGASVRVAVETKAERHQDCRGPAFPSKHFQC
jgi:hypothetical protein